MKKILITLFLAISFLPIFDIVSASGNINTHRGTESTGREDINNNHLDQMGGNEFFDVNITGEKGIRNLLIAIARDLKNVVFAFVSLIVIILAIKLIFGENTEEEAKKLKSGVLWGSIGIMIMQIALSTHKLLFSDDDLINIGSNLTKRIIEPFINMLMLFASFIFIAVGIYAFYKIVTAGGEEDKVSKGKMSIVYAVIGFVVIKFSDIIVNNTFEIKDKNIGTGKILNANITKNAEIIIDIINWTNSFLAIIIVIMVMYAGFLVLTSSGDSEKHDKAKKILLYVGIGLLILFASYLILTFFLRPGGMTI